jgi:tetratricopeptide (TPR) repeat protein
MKCSYSSRFSAFIWLALPTMTVLSFSHVANAGISPLDIVSMTTPTEVSPDEQARRWNEAGMTALQARRVDEAMAFFGQTISSYEGRFHDPEIRYLAARGQAEAIYTLANAVKEDSAKKAIIISSHWLAAQYLLGFSMGEKGNYVAGLAALEKARAMAPKNALVLSEIGHHYQQLKNWEAALGTFQLAHAAALEFSPPQVKLREAGRALRGIGYSLTELKRFSEAKANYQLALDLNSSDAIARQELRYVENLLLSKQD